ncbi:DUF3618 domain-containing protein [Brevibacterium ravenspurgense]|uniref:DUF3618 domain-containing protein n=1 Tax=Brevibacterium ravenspurgense TaxID=479117 RepID=UPI001427D5E9
MRVSNVYTSDITVDNASKAQLEESIRLREQRLAANIDTLIGEVHPKAIAARATGRVKGAAVNSDGSVRADTAALVGGVVLSAAAIVALGIVRSQRKY